MHQLYCNAWYCTCDAVTWLGALDSDTTYKLYDSIISQAQAILVLAEWRTLRRCTVLDDNFIYIRCFMIED